MADLAVTGSQVISGAQQYIDGIAFSSITAGQPCYRNAAGTIAPAQADGTAVEATVIGISTHPAAIGQPIRLQTKGRIVLGAAAAPVAGAIYVLSATAGTFANAGDITTAGHFSVILGIGVGSNAVDIQIHFNSLAVVPTP